MPQFSFLFKSLKMVCETSIKPLGWFMYPLECFVDSSERFMEPLELYTKPSERFMNPLAWF